MAEQSTAAARQERLDLLAALADAKSVRDHQEIHLVFLRKRHDEVLQRYNDLYKCYETLHKRHGDLQGQFHLVCTKLKKALEMQTELESVRVALDKEKGLKEAAELQAEHIRSKLASHQEWNTRELQSRDGILEELEEDAEKRDAELESRDHLIEALQRDIQERDAARARLEEALESTERQANALMRDYETKAAEIARLSGQVTEHELTMEKLQDEVAILASENESANRVIGGLKDVQNRMKASHAEVMQQLETENNDLREVLDEMATSNCELKDEIDGSAKQFDAEKVQELQHENASLRRELEAAKQALLAKFPGLNANLDNLSSVLDGNETGRKGRKRKCVR